MHQLRTQAIVRRFRVSALLFVAIPIFFIASLVVIAISVAHVDLKLAGVGIGLGMLALLSGALCSLSSTQTACPLCLTPVLLNRRCSTHGRAKKAFGSYALRVALSILFLNSFRCPYCNEPTVVRARRRPVAGRRKT